MPAGTLKRTGPLALTNTYTTNVFNNTDSAIYDVIKRIYVVNKTGSAATFRLYIGATGANTAGTEFFFDQSVAANSVYTSPPLNIKMLSTDFLVGGASATTTLTITIEREQFVV